MAEARLRSDVYERGFAPLVAGGLEFRGLPGEGVIVYQAHNDLQETLFMGGPLVIGETYHNAAEGFTVQVLQTIEGGMTVCVTAVPDLRAIVPDVFGLRPAEAGKLVHDAGLVSSFTGADPSKPSYVRSQSPTAGQLVDAGSTVTMFLEAGSPP